MSYGDFMAVCAQQRKLMLDSIKRQEECIDLVGQLAKLNSESAASSLDPKLKANHEQIAKFYSDEGVEIYRQEIVLKNLSLEMISNAMRTGCAEIERKLENG